MSQFQSQRWNDFPKTLCVNLQLKHKLLQVICMDFHGAELMENFAGAKEAIKKVSNFISLLPEKTSTST